jgi:phosphatidylserine/phosphatidylglycerophosphate/cardiolipin synthase-like enzyme
MNLSTNAMDNNREISIRIDDPDVLRKFRRQFLEDWELGYEK